MSFKNRVHLCGALFLSFFSVGCSDFLNGKKEEPKVIELSDSHFTCLQRVPGTLKIFFKGEAHEKELVEDFNCLTEALRNFHKRTFGSVEGGYTSEDLRKFFGKYFLKENNVSPEFAADLMKIKQVILGGSANHLTKKELLQLIEIHSLIRDEFVQLAPHMKNLLFIGDKRSLNWEQASASTEQLRSSLQHLLGETQIANVEYSFDDLKRAFHGFAEFVKGEDQQSIYELYAKWFPVIESVKNVLIGSKARIAGLPQWKENLDTLIDLYGLALKHHYFLHGMKLDNAQNLSHVSQAVGQSIKLLLNTHQIKNTGRIPLEDIDNLIEQVLPKVTASLQAKSLKKAYRVVLLKILDPEKNGDSRTLQGLEKKHLISLQREFNIWRLQQSFINSLSMEDLEGGIVAKGLFDAYNKFNKTYVIEKSLSEDPLEQGALETSWKDLGDLLKHPYPVSFDAQGQLIITDNMASLKQSWSSLTEANLMRALSRVLLLGYAEHTHGPLSEALMSKKGLISWYDDFQEVGLDLKAFDPRSANSGGRSFLEANFFTYSGNGDDYMDQKETYEFVSFLFSAGLASSEALRKDLTAFQCSVPEKDVFGYFFMNEPCFKKRLKEKFEVYFDNLPGLVQYVKSLDKTQWDFFYRYLLAASSVETQRPGLVETANIRTMTMVLHYIESIISLYDKDRNQVLSLDEVRIATPRFMSFVKTVSPVESETIMKEGFTYLVFKGKIPGVMDLARFQLDKLKGLPGAQRMELVRLFGVLKDQLNKSKN